MNSLILNTHYPPISPFLEVNASQTQFGSVSPFMIMNKEKEEEEPKMNSWKFIPLVSRKKWGEMTKTEKLPEKTSKDGWAEMPFVVVEAEEQWQRGALLRKVDMTEKFLGCEEKGKEGGWERNRGNRMGEWSRVGAFKEDGKSEEGKKSEGPEKVPAIFAPLILLSIKSTDKS